MRGIGKRLRAAVALAALLPTPLLAQSASVQVVCTVRSYGNDLHTYRGGFAVVDGKLQLVEDGIQLAFLPSKTTFNKPMIAEHGGNASWQIDYRNGALAKASFYDYGFVLTDPATTLTRTVTAGKTVLTDKQSVSGTEMPRIDPDFTTLQLPGMPRAVSVSLAADGKKFATYAFNLNGATVKKHADALSAKYRAQFRGTAFDLAANHGGRADDVCEAPSSSSGASGCYLTTAAVSTVGLDDDCWELRQLRAFRDRILARGGERAARVADYYRRAPKVVAGIARRTDARRVWLKAYFGGIVPAAIAARLGRDDAAYAIYIRASQRLEAMAHG